jgi:hypothetical protein
VHGIGGEAGCAQSLRETVRAALGAHKDECQLALSAQLFHERVNPIVPLHRNEAVLHGGRTVTGGRMLVENGVARVLASYAAGLAFQGGREEHRLAPGGTEGDDAVEGGSEAHVQHAVPLVHDQEANA